MTLNEETKFAKEIGAMQSTLTIQTKAINQLSLDLKEYIKNQSEFAQECARAHYRISTHDKQLDTLTIWARGIDKIIPSLVSTNKILIFIGSGLGLSIIGLIWALITGQITLVFS